MRYYITETADAGSGLATATHVRESYNEARMLFHQVRASALANAGVVYSLCVVFDEKGDVYDREWSGKLSDQLKAEQDALKAEQDAQESETLELQEETTCTVS